MTLAAFPLKKPSQSADNSNCAASTQTPLLSPRDPPRSDRPRSARPGASAQRAVREFPRVEQSEDDQHGQAGRAAGGPADRTPVLDFRSRRRAGVDRVGERAGRGCVLSRAEARVDGYRLSVIGYWLLVIGYWLLREAAVPCEALAKQGVFNHEWARMNFSKSATRNAEPETRNFDLLPLPRGLASGRQDDWLRRFP